VSLAQRLRTLGSKRSFFAREDLFPRQWTGLSAAEVQGAGNRFAKSKLPAPKRWRRYALVGLGLATGAPLGWLLLRIAGGRTDLVTEIHDNPGLYAYLLLGTGLVFGIFGAMLGLLGDRLALSNQDLANLATTDALTLLRNARYFWERLREERARAQRDKRGLGLIVLDLDEFKSVNDRRGHVCGNTLLQGVARRLADSTREIDVVCRIGGEEFGVICPGAQLPELNLIAERMRAALTSSPLPCNGDGEKITASFGVASLRDGQTAEALFANADAALYEAKRLGRNRVSAALALRIGPILPTPPS